MKVTFSTHVEFEDSEIEIEFEADLSRGGIGAYEFWGQKCYDRGEYEIDNITFDEQDLTPEQIGVVSKKAEKGDFDDIVWDKVAEIDDRE